MGVSQGLGERERDKRLITGKRMIEVKPDDIRKVKGKWHRLTGGRGGAGLLAIKVEWCKFCKVLEREVHDAMGRRPFTFYHMDGDSIPARWKMRDMGADSFPSLFLVLPDGTLCPYDRGRKAEKLLMAARLAENG